MKLFRNPLCAAVALALLPVPAVYAQEGASAIEEIVVSARKRDESLQDVPIAITAFTEETIEKAGIGRPADFIGLMPNVTLVDTANVGDTQVSIRGIVSTRDAESTFAYVVDGVLSTNPNSFNEELVDIQQIEVLKGPQGALYGRNAVAGAILVTTKEPQPGFDGAVKLGAGNYGAQNGSIRLSGGSETLRGSLVGSYRTFDGFYENIFLGSDDSVDYLEDTTVRGRLLFEPNDTFRLDIRGGTSEVEGGAINFNAAFAIPAFETVFGSPTFNADPNDNEFIYAFNTPGINNQETTDFSLKADWDNGGVAVTVLATYNDLTEDLLSDGTSATFYGYELTPACQADRATLNNFPAALGGADRTDLFGPFFQPFGIFPPGGGDPALDFAGVYGPYTPTSCDGFQYQARNQEDTGFEIRLTSPQDQSIRWIAGIYAAEIEREVVVSYGADTGNGFLLQPYVGPTGPNPTDLLFWDDFDTSVIAVFGELSFDVGDASEVSLALRWDEEDRSVSNRVPNVAASGLNINTLTTTGPGPINPGFLANPTGIPDRSAKFDQLQPKVTWRTAIDDNVNLYASWGIGFRSGGFNSLGSSALLNLWFNDQGNPALPGAAVDARLVINDEYEKEVSSAFEVGLKSTWLDNRLRVNAALVNTDVDDNQFFEFFAGPFGILRVVTTIEEVSISGFETDFTYVVDDNWTVYGGMGFLDSEIERNENRPLSVGNPVPQAPDFTGNFGAQYEQEFGRSMSFFARADWQYIGETYFHTLQGEETPTIWQVFFPDIVTALGAINNNFAKSSRDPYDTLNLRAGISGERWSLTAYGRNVLDEEYLEEIIPAPEFGGSFIHQGQGSAYGVEFSIDF